MFGFQTLSCLHEIPVVRSSTNKLQDVYVKAKETSVLIRLPCNVAETVADKSFKIVLTVVNPFVKLLSGPVRVIDDYAVQKIRQIESKYPVINTRTEDVVNTFNEKTEPVRNVMNSVKDTTTSTIQHGKETVSNVATATVNKASGVADSVFSFCETHVPGIQRRNSGKSTGLIGFASSTVSSLIDQVFQPVQSSLIWVRMLAVFFLLKSKQINDLVLNKLQQKRVLTAAPQRLLIFVGTFLEYFIGRIRPDDRTLAELKKSQQQNRASQPSYFVNRSNLKQDASIKTRQGGAFTNQETRTNGANTDYSNFNDTEELYARLANNDLRPSVYNDEYTNEPVDFVENGDIGQLHARLANNDLRQSVHNDEYITEPTDLVENGDIGQLHAQLKPTDIELLYARLPTDIIPDTNEHEQLNEDQQ
jgi:hypothetical protein